MTKKVLFASSVVIGVLGLALVVGAQGPGGPGPRPRDGFGRGGFGGPEGPGGLLLSRSNCTANCPEYQFKVTITSQELFWVGGVAKSVPITTTGTIAGFADGSTYRDVNLSGIGPWGSQGGPQEVIYIRNRGTMMNYIVHVGKGGPSTNTYEQFAIQPPRTPPADGHGKGPNNGVRPGNAPAVTGLNYTVPGIGGYMCKAEQTSTSHQIQLPGSAGTATITTNRVYCPELKLVLEEDHSDPRFGTRTYVLSDYVKTPLPDLLTPAGTMVQGKAFGHHGGPGGGI